MIKSILVVAGSHLLCVVHVFASHLLLSHVFPGDFVRGRVPSNPPLLAGTALFVVFSRGPVRFAPRRRARHALWFGIVGEVIGIASTIANWSNGSPRWGDSSGVGRGSSHLLPLP